MCFLFIYLFIYIHYLIAIKFLFSIFLCNFVSVAFLYCVLGTFIVALWASGFPSLNKNFNFNFLGMNIVQDVGTNSVWIGQPAYTEALLKTFGMDHAKVSATPVD